MWNRPKNWGFGVVRFFDVVKPVALVPVRFPTGSGNEPAIWNCCYHYVSWMLWMSCIAGRATKSKDTCNVSELLALHWLDDKPNKSSVVRCVLIASDVCEAVRYCVLLPIWVNSHSVHMAVNVSNDWMHVSLELPTTWPSHQATSYHDHIHPPTPSAAIYQMYESYNSCQALCYPIFHSYSAGQISLWVA